ncbi:J domain-containing protein [Methanoculleus sp. FWC-SCC1]|uniref:J domain-containing protein n=1 Tax=Methanoculleus frigidifontis TaxID=2584085 RepID=A0ABT8M658_9EURY|nr:J domain-containing protein [Methanoculleus sp. FWC-SCC1]
MVVEDYYAVLGVTHGADEREIRSAYRRLVKRYHPDTSSEPDAAEKFLKIQEAYETLSDPAKRAEYDMLLATGQARTAYTGDGESPGYQQTTSRQYTYYYKPGKGFSRTGTGGGGTLIAVAALVMLLVGAFFMIFVLLLKALLAPLTRGNGARKK